MRNDWFAYICVTATDGTIKSDAHRNLISLKIILKLEIKIFIARDVEQL